MKAYKDSRKTLTGETANRAMMRALACSQSNASMEDLRSARRDFLRHPAGGLDHGCRRIGLRRRRDAPGHPYGGGRREDHRSERHCGRRRRRLPGRMRRGGSHGRRRSDRKWPAAPGAIAPRRSHRDQKYHGPHLRSHCGTGKVSCSKRNASGVLNALSSADLALGRRGEHHSLRRSGGCCYVCRGAGLASDFKETARWHRRLTHSKALAETIRG